MTVSSATWPFQGFRPPVDNAPAINVVNAGRAIPVKFSLGGYQGMSIFADATYPRSGTLACDSTALIDPIESTVTAAGSSLNYDATNDTYNYVWKTDKGWASSCRQLVIKFADGTYQYANFKFTR